MYYDLGISKFMLIDKRMSDRVKHNRRVFHFCKNEVLVYENPTKHKSVYETLYYSVDVFRNIKDVITFFDNLLKDVASTPTIDFGYYFPDDYSYDYIVSKYNKREFDENNRVYNTYELFNCFADAAVRCAYLISMEDYIVNVIHNRSTSNINRRREVKTYASALLCRRATDYQCYSELTLSRLVLDSFNLGNLSESFNKITSVGDIIEKEIICNLLPAINKIGEPFSVLELFEMSNRADDSNPHNAFDSFYDVCNVDEVIDILALYDMFVEEGVFTNKLCEYLGIFRLLIGFVNEYQPDEQP